MRWVATLLSLFVGCSLACAAQPGAPSQRLFEFHSGFWINLHHFLYLQASLTDPPKGARSRSLTSADSDELQKLSPAERSAWNDAVAHYEAFAKHDLLFDDELIAAKNELEDNEASPDLAGARLPQAMKTALLEAAAVYRKHWWPRHDADNRRWIALVEPAVAQHGAGLAADLERIYAAPWPEYPVRVDTVAYANWAGAYTTIEPTRPTISTADAGNAGDAALEVLFHETSHGMVEKVRDALAAAEADLNAHRAGTPFHAGSLWHAVLFYTAGELVAERIPGHVPYADKSGLWVRAWPDPDRKLIEQDWLPHMNGKTDLRTALNKLAVDMAEVPRK